MATEDICREKLGGDAFLAGVDNLGVWRRGGNLGNVSRFDRVTEYNACHAGKLFGREDRVAASMRAARQAF
jgi:hypothetical protein